MGQSLEHWRFRWVSRARSERLRDDAPGAVQRLFELLMHQKRELEEEEMRMKETMKNWRIALI